MSQAASFPATVPLCADHLDRMRSELLSSPPPQTTPMVDAIVYYVTWDAGVTVKIGTTTNPRHRFNDFLRRGTFEVLAAEPGHYEVEGQRHRQFAALNIGQEMFHLGAPIKAHLDHLRCTGDWRALIEDLHQKRGGRAPIFATNRKYK